MPVCLPLFGRLFALCVVSSPPPKTTPCVPLRCFINTCLPDTTLILNPIVPNPWRAPYTLPLGRTPRTHKPPCHSPNPSPLSFPPPSMTVHGPTWCRGRLRSIGLRALYSPNGMTSVSYSACATTQSGLSSTLPLGGIAGQTRVPCPCCFGSQRKSCCRDVFKRATDSGAAWLACSASFCAAILESIGDANRLASNRGS
jgi:hypothetical protein